MRLAAKPIAPVMTEAARPISAGVSSVVTSHATPARPANISQLDSTDAVPPLSARRCGVGQSISRSLSRTGDYTQPVTAKNDQPVQDGDSAALSVEQVRRLAALSHLAPPPEQIEGLRRDLGAVLGYAECLARAPLDGLEPMIRPVEDANRLDEDEPGETLDRSVLGEIAPDGGRAFDGTFIRVPRVIDGGDGGGGGS